jgi:hypothetical protein
VRRRTAPLVAVLALALGAGCAGCDDAPHHGDAEPLRVTWREATLPLPPGPPGRIAVRDAAACNGTWYAVGAVVGPTGTTRPAAWTSADGRAWRPLPIAPHAYYARRAVLGSVACRGGQVAAVGARSGGAHGNPRVTTWHQRPDGALVDVRAAFELFGGPNAVSVRRIAANPAGGTATWLIAGNRLSGAAVWVSADATGFRIVEHDPALSSDAVATTAALDQVHDGTGWTVVGRAQTDGHLAPSPLAGTSPDGTDWTRQAVPAGTRGFADLERVVRAGDRLLAAGLRGSAFGTWTRSNGRWHVAEGFGRVVTGTGEPAFVSGLATSGDKILASVCDGARFRLWGTSGDGRWASVRTPSSPAGTGDTLQTVVADLDTVLLLSDDGTSGRVWVARWITLGR